MDLSREISESFFFKELRVVSLIEGQEQIAAEIDWHGILLEDLWSELKADTELDLRGVTICEFSQGKITRLSYYS